ncbi:MAG: hypothetical protein MZU91_12670 [Desulfosudis oleivorans]|nr:hypothetical protein [Desulfosudis oleivorans]
MIFAFAPIVALLLGISVDHRAVGHAADLGGAVHRDPGDHRAAHPRARAGCAAGRRRSMRLLATIGPWSIAALLLTLVLLFAFQGEQILRAAADHRACWRCRS